MASCILEVLSGKRDLTVKMIIALHKHLSIPTDTLLGVGRGHRQGQLQFMS
jgi:antitoxin component HigA of HigAB toxin-antitoxin module